MSGNSVMSTLLVDKKDNTGRSAIWQAPWRGVLGSIAGAQRAVSRTTIPSSPAPTPHSQPFSLRSGEKGVVPGRQRKPPLPSETGEGAGGEGDWGGGLRRKCKQDLPDQGRQHKTGQTGNENEQRFGNSRAPEQS